MSFSRVNALGWGLYEELSSAQMNALDIDHANALDKTGDALSAGALIEWSGTNHPRLASRSVDRVQPLFIAGATVGGGSDDFVFVITTGAIKQVYVASGAPAVQIPLTNLIDLATLDEIRVIVDPAGADADPSQKPRLELYSMGSGGRTKIGSTITDPATSPNYRPEHEIVMPTIGHGIDESGGRSYFLLFLGESSTNAAVDLLVLGLTCTFTVTQLTPGG
jgi:hypothetical protein